MAKKRFTDIEIWDKEWYMELKPKHKCLMKYIFDKCDSSGCWKPNWKLASLHIGEDVNESDLKLLPSHQYEIIENGKVFIPDFINFQYGQLSKKSPAHNPIFLAIEKNNLNNRVFNRVSNTLQEEEEDIDKEKDKEKDKGGEGGMYELKKKVDNGFDTMPVKEHFNGLPEIKIGAAKEFVRLTQYVELTDQKIIEFWGVFKIQNLTGKKYYPNKDAVYSHFLNWIKTQNFNKNGINNFKGSTSANGGGLHGTSIVAKDKQYKGGL